MDRDRIQKDLDMTASWSYILGMEFNIMKCKLMHVGRSNRNFEYVLNGSKLQVAVIKNKSGTFFMAHGVFSKELRNKNLLKFSPHLKSVATLPCET